MMGFTSECIHLSSHPHGMQIVESSQLHDAVPFPNGTATSLQESWIGLYSKSVLHFHITTLLLFHSSTQTHNFTEQ